MLVSAAPLITYASHPDATPEGELETLAAVYSFVLQKGREKKEGARPGAPDARKESNGSGTPSIPE